MKHTAEVKYDRNLIRRALNGFMFKRLGWPGVLGLFGPLIIILAAFILDISLSSIYLLILLVIFSILAGLIIFIYILRLKTSEGFFAKSSNPTVKFTFSEEGITTQSDIGSSELKWEVFDELLKLDDIWLLIYAGSGYITLPISSLSEECKNFIETKV